MDMAWDEGSLGVHCMRHEACVEGKNVIFWGLLGGAGRKRGGEGIVLTSYLSEDALGCLPIFTWSEWGWLWE